MKVPGNIGGKGAIETLAWTFSVDFDLKLCKNGWLKEQCFGLITPTAVVIWFRGGHLFILGKAEGVLLLWCLLSLQKWNLGARGIHTEGMIPNYCRGSGLVKCSTEVMQYCHNEDPFPHHPCLFSQNSTSPSEPWYIEPIFHSQIISSLILVTYNTQDDINKILWLCYISCIFLSKKIYTYSTNSDSRYI